LQGSRPIEKSILIPSALVRADAVMLEQMFFNVLDNAIVHTPEATAIEVKADAHQGALRITVEDAGPGIPAEDHERVFERFYQVPSRRADRSGSGLGLSIARGFARSIGGDVQVADRGSGLAGTRLIIELPLETDDSHGR
jgi:signal transduction histidine kinase